MEWFGPTMSYRVLNKASCNAGARGYHSFEASVVYYEVANFADEALLDEAPEHIAAVVTVGGLVEGLLAEAVAVRGKEFHGDDRSRHSEFRDSRESTVVSTATRDGRTFYITALRDVGDRDHRLRVLHSGLGYSREHRARHQTTITHKFSRFLAGDWTA